MRINLRRTLAGTLGALACTVQMGSAMARASSADPFHRVTQRPAFSRSPISARRQSRRV